MNQLLTSIEESLEKENWFGALFIAISLPDICGATENVVHGNGARYKDWFNRYLKPRYNADNIYEQMLITSPESLQGLPQEIVNKWKQQAPMVAFTAEDCWSLRNACLHEGVDENRLRTFRITPPSKVGGTMHMNNINGTLQLDILNLCKDIVSAVRQWIDDMQQKPDVVAKLEKMITIDRSTFKGIVYFRD
ncbi:MULTISPECIES: hypothetical protein [Klebsiella]|uniref:hypothetical protein n=1 Tax=Klebsiella TaxID=570 RepID=UPI0016609743|nr:MULTISPECIES: hypothetical protein [Klebsiella]HED1709655.1 hypothetical protein [Klebsiella variicola subsp. variicola]MBD0720888.1 hypothetical protein [Klebsiella variicola]MCH9370099.1 hypothetical protein [Klebsiella pneumoniae]MCH9400773.1 hypothetical protein [Klebsiella pneumoniae]MCM6346776.1 hypothetical protein [Klebsiella pneumoniae]